MLRSENSTDKIIRIDSFNPYETRFPNRRLITRDTLIIMKLLRSEGYRVIVEPENEQPLQYLYKKGTAQWFADPVNILFFSIPLTILTNLIVNQIQKLIDGKGNKPTPNINITIDNSIHTYNYLGEAQPEGNTKRISLERKALKEGFDRCFEARPPKTAFPTPIYLEHKPKIVGWCRLWESDKGLESEGFILDKVVKRRISQKRLNGASVTGIASVTECSICNFNYLECNHIAGEDYDGKHCFNTIKETTFVETSIVKEPINKECILGWA